MAFVSKREKLKLSEEEKGRLWRIMESSTESSRKVERASILTGYADGKSISLIARELNTNRPKVERCIDKALQYGVLAALGDLPRRGRPQKISAEARKWLRQLHANHEDWTIDRLAEYARQYGEKAGYKGLGKIGKGTVSKILSKDKAKSLPKAEVLYLCEEIEVYYLVVALDLTSGFVLTVKVHEKYDTGNFIRILDDHIDPVYQGVKDIKLFLNPKKTDLTSGDIKQYLKSKANRFKFEFMPSHNQAANLAELLIIRMTKNLVRQLRVTSRVDLEQKIKEFLQ